MAHLQEDLVPEVVLEQTTQDIHREVGPRMAHVARVVHRGAARVPAHLVGVMVSTDLEHREDNVLVIDVGTNGEIALLQSSLMAKRVCECYPLQAKQRLRSRSTLYLHLI